MAKTIEMIGREFGLLTVIAEAERNSWGQRTWICKCKCGNTTAPIVSSNLKHTKSCGCWRAERTKKEKIALSHSKSNTRLYFIWQGIKQRCNRVGHTQYANYGGRGISVCEEWQSDFQTFYNWAMANGYDENAEFGKCTLDRIDVNGNYEPSNCRWVDMKTQQNNRRNNKHRKEVY